MPSMPTMSTAGGGGGGGSGSHHGGVGGGSGGSSNGGGCFLPPMPFDGEAYLESLVENLQTLPAEIRRNLRLMREMDGSCSNLLEETDRLQRGYLSRVEGKMDRLEVVGDEGLRVSRAEAAADRDENDDGDARMSDADATDDQNEKELDLPPLPPPMIPTTEELLAHVHEPAALAEIESLRGDALQRAEEKVAIATQTLELVDNLCRKLETDLRSMERSLAASDPGGGPLGSAAAAASSSASSSSNAAAAQSSSSSSSSAPKRAPKKDDLAAVQEVPGSPDWILARVLSYDGHKKLFKLSDEDPDSIKIFHLPDRRVIVLERMRNLRAGDVVFAVYPDTTSFYKGTIAQPPRKAPAGMFVMVTFVDDEDAATGKTLDKAVLLKHVMPPPPAF